MKVKVGNTVYSTDDYPLMIILTNKDRANIENMSPTATRYCCFSDNHNMSKEEIEKWMDKLDNRKEVGVDPVEREQLSDCSALIEITKEGQCGLHLPIGKKADEVMENEKHTMIAAGIAKLIGGTNLATIAHDLMMVKEGAEFEIPLLININKEKGKKDGNK